MTDSNCAHNWVITEQITKRLPNGTWQQEFLMYECSKCDARIRGPLSLKSDESFEHTVTLITREPDEVASD